MFIDNPPNIAFKGHADWAADFFDDKIEELTGYRKEEFNSRKLRWIDLVVEEDLPAMAKVFFDAREGSKAYVREYRIKTRSGDIVWVQEGSRIVCDKDGQVECITGAFTDVTERKRAEEALRESQEKFSKAFSASPDAISIATLTDGYFIDANEAFLEATGYTRQQVIGHTARELDIWDNPADRMVLVSMVRERGSVRSLEFKFRKSSGEVRSMLCSAEVIELGGRECLLMIGRDITERKRLEEQLRQGQKLRSIGVLAGGVAHDFNNLLQIIQGYAELLLKNKTKDHPDFKKLNGILQATLRGCELTQQMLTFSRNMEAKKCPIDLNTTIEQVASLIEHMLPKKITIRQQLASGLRLIHADPIQIEQVIMNLVINAKDAMPEGGKIIIETRNITLDEAHCRTYPMARPGDYVLLSVSDTGCGMDKETLDCIFEPFYSTKGPCGGTGLGLAIVYGIIQNHEGHVICYSEPEMGTTFKIFLPANKTAQTLIG